MNLEALKEPFPESEIEWRIGQSGVNDAGKVWAKVLAYLTNRAIMDRLDTVCGPTKWRNEYRHFDVTVLCKTDDGKPAETYVDKNAGVLCGISINIDGEWITKWDGASATDIESVKGGLSDSMKRAAVQWGIGRYLYELSVTWAEVSENGSRFASALNKNSKQWQSFKWDPPKLSSAFLPKAVATSPGKAGPKSKAPAKPADVVVMPDWVKQLDALLVACGCKCSDDANAVLKWATGGDCTAPEQYRQNPELARPIYDQLSAMKHNCKNVLEAARAASEPTDPF